MAFSGEVALPQPETSHGNTVSDMEVIQSTLAAMLLKSIIILTSNQYKILLIRYFAEFFCMGLQIPALILLFCLSL